MSKGQHTSSAQADDRVVRRGSVYWLTHPPSGKARIESESKGFGAMPVSLPQGDSVPEEAAPGELLAIAYAVQMAVALSAGLTLAGSPANEIVVKASCTFTGPLHDHELVALDLHVSGRVPGLDAEDFRQAVEGARGRALRSAGAREDLPGELESKLEDA